MGRGFNPHRGILLFLTVRALHKLAHVARGFNPHRGILLFLTDSIPVSCGAQPGFNPHRGILLFLTERAGYLAHARTRFQSPSGHSALSNGPGCTCSGMRWWSAFQSPSGHSALSNYLLSRSHPQPGLRFNPHRGILLFLTLCSSVCVSSLCPGFNPHRGILLFLTARHLEGPAWLHAVSIPIGAFCSF